MDAELGQEYPSNMKNKRNALNQQVVDDARKVFQRMRDNFLATGMSEREAYKAAEAILSKMTAAELHEAANANLREE